jgi:hypothetical protein
LAVTGKSGHIVNLLGSEQTEGADHSLLFWRRASKKRVTAVRDAESDLICASLEKDDFHGDWNDVLLPQ